MDSIAEIKDRIRDEMKRQGLNQAEVERRGGLEPKSLSDFLTRVRKRPSHTLFAGIARGFGKTVLWLTGENEMRDDEAAVSAMHNDRLPRCIKSQLSSTDPYMARIVEDLIDLLISKNLVSESELPAAAQQLIQRRRSLRRPDQEDPLE